MFQRSVTKECYKRVLPTINITCTRPIIYMGGSLSDSASFLRTIVNCDKGN